MVATATITIALVTPATPLNRAQTMAKCCLGCYCHHHGTINDKKGPRCNTSWAFLVWLFFFFLFTNNVYITLNTVQDINNIGNRHRTQTRVWHGCESHRSIIFMGDTGMGAVLKIQTWGHTMTHHHGVTGFWQVTSLIYFPEFFHIFKLIFSYFFSIFFF